MKMTDSSKIRHWDKVNNPRRIGDLQYGPLLLLHDAHMRRFETACNDRAYRNEKREVSVVVFIFWFGIVKERKPLLLLWARKCVSNRHRGGRQRPMKDEANQLSGVGQDIGHGFLRLVSAEFFNKYGSTTSWRRRKNVTQKCRCVCEFARATTNPSLLHDPGSWKTYVISCARFGIEYVTTNDLDSVLPVWHTLSNSLIVSARLHTVRYFRYVKTNAQTICCWQHQSRLTHFV